MTDLTSTTPSQDRAIDVIIAGGTQLDAADAAGVTRQTVSVWCNQHPGFCASLNARRHELVAKRTDLIRDMDIEALAVIAAEIASGNITVALAFSKSRQFHTVDVTDVGWSRAESLMNARADEVQKRPEHAGAFGGRSIRMEMRPSFLVNYSPGIRVVKAQALDGNESKPVR